MQFFSGIDTKRFTKGLIVWNNVLWNLFKMRIGKRKKRKKRGRKKKPFNHLSIKPQLYPTVTLILATRHTKESLYGHSAALSCQHYFCKEYCSDINQRKKFRKHNNTQGHFLAVHKYKLQLIYYNNISYDITSFKVENNLSLCISHGNVTTNSL